MDKNVLKKFAIESRQELMEKVANKINRYFVDEEFNVNQNGEVYVLVNDKHTLRLTKSEYENRQLLVKRIKEITLEQVIEEAAYTWFNRIIAIRYMEIHDYLPLTKDNQSLGVRVLSSKDNTPDPEIMKISNLINPDLDIEFNKEYYGTIQDNNKRFEYILLLICKKLSNVIPQVFDGITDYIDILIPDNLLNDSGYITKLLQEVDIENFNKVEVIGWLYQYYISEKKDEVFAALKKNIKIKKENIPSATQIFTPNWIVKYMVENTICRSANISGDKIVKNFNYYVKDVNGYDSQNMNNTKLEEITFLDPCCGSGHILVYAFEMLYKLYEMEGYNKNDIAAIILKKNIYGIDIDDRACQLANLSLLLKARQFDKMLFSKKIYPHVISIKESNNINKSVLTDIMDNETTPIIDYVLDVFYDAKELGSIINVEEMNFQSVIDKINNLDNIFSITLKKELIPLLEQAQIMSKKYNVTVTNPPYMGTKGMGNKLTEYTKKHFQNSKVDMFSVFIEKARAYTKNDGYYALITQPTFLFLSSFEKLRNKIIKEQNVLSLLHMGRGIFGIDFGSCSFVIKNTERRNWKGNYFRLHKRTFQYIDVQDIERIFLNAKDDLNYKFDFGKYKPSEDIYEDKEEKDEDSESNLRIKFECSQDDFLKIPSFPFAYWVNENTYSLFKNKKLGELSTIKEGVKTGENDKFIREWYEVDINKTNINGNNKAKWIKHTKGGNVRKWYGNNLEVLNYENDGEEIKKFPKSSVTGSDNFYKENITWSRISSSVASFRYTEQGFIPNMAGLSLYCEKNKINYYIGLLNSVVVKSLLQLMNPTLNFPPGTIANLPIIESNNSDIEKLVEENISIAKEDWNNYEISWDFETHPLLKNRTLEISDKIHNKQQLRRIYDIWKKECDEKFAKLKINEEKLNQLYIDIYGLKDELMANIQDKDVTIRKADKEREIKSLISYSVGCMFGRYSLDEDGIIFAGGEFNKNKYNSFEVDADNIIPITEENYFGDDIVSRFKKFIEIVYGKETLYENLEFIAETLGKRNGENNEDTIRRYFINDFYNDHVKMYQKRPIYWLFDSGKKNGFKCLIYMHRYNESLVSKVRLDYLHRIQNTYEKELKDITDKLNTNIDLTNKRELSKRQADISAKLQETNEYDEKIAHIADQKIKIDLDDGIVVNYAKFSVKNPKTGKDESILANI